MNLIHGYSRRGKQSPEYRAYHDMINRCTNKKLKNFRHYGGRGIRVCSRWLNSFENFLSDMGERPSPKHSLDRIKNNGNYNKSNCRWATKAEQCSNMRSNLMIEFKGEKMCLAALAKKIGINRSTIKYRLLKGLPIIHKNQFV